MIDQDRDHRVEFTFDDSECRVPQSGLGQQGTDVFRPLRVHDQVSRALRQPKVFTGLGGNTVTALGRLRVPFALNLTF